MFHSIYLTCAGGLIYVDDANFQWIILIHTRIIGTNRLASGSRLQFATSLT